MAYCPGHVTVAQHGALQAAAGGRVRWVNGGNTVERLRAIKDPAELETMKASRSSDQ